MKTILSIFMVATIALGSTYTTTFQNQENPISQNFIWLNGKKDGVQWTDLQTSNSMVFGTLTNCGGSCFKDSVGCLTGAWGSNQAVTVKLFTALTSGNDIDFPEAEIHLRKSIAANNIRGYEIMFSQKHDSTTYIACFRWDGAPPGTGVSLFSLSGSQYISTNGSTLMASITNSTIWVFQNGNLITNITDTTYGSGAPGIGFDYLGSEGPLFGFTSFTATDFQPPAPIKRFNMGVISVSTPIAIGGQ